MDDYPIHQTAQPIAVPVSGDLNHYDRYFFNGYSHDGSLYFAAALGVYPNRQVIDASFSVVRWDGAAGTQVAVHASGRCPLDRTRTEVGPIRVEVVEPLQTLAVHVRAPDQGLRASLTFRHRTVAVQEAPFHLQVGTRVVMDYTRLTQFGAWEGWVEVDGEHLVVSASEVQWHARRMELEGLKSDLHRYLQVGREALLWKLEGLSEYDCSATDDADRDERARSRQARRQRRSGLSR
jgi:hypothetical protein